MDTAKVETFVVVFLEFLGQAFETDVTAHLVAVRVGHPQREQIGDAAIAIAERMDALSDQFHAALPRRFVDGFGAICSEAGFSKSSSATFTIRLAEGNLGQEFVMR